jgi:hypothetical protein
LVEHLQKTREDAIKGEECKIEMLKAEVVKVRNELQSVKKMQERQCMCKYYEETLAKVKEDNARFIERLKTNYQKDLEEYRGRYDDLKLKVALDINEKTLHFIKERHAQYFETYCQEKKINGNASVDSIECLFYICQR